jgi:hypothetical protein
LICHTEAGITAIAQTEISFKVLKRGDIVQETTHEISIPAMGRQKISFALNDDVADGRYIIEASLINTPFGTIKSIRDFENH